MRTIDPKTYGDVAASLIADAPATNALGPGRPNMDASDALGDASIAALFGDRKILDRDMALCCLSGLWLLHDFLDDSHTLSQGVGSPSGSYWHGIMHRREPDESNAGYWFRRVGAHPIFGELATDAKELADASPLKDSTLPFLDGADWDAYGFIDTCAQNRGRENDAEALCKTIQRREWELLFDCCWTAATD